MIGPDDPQFQGPRRRDPLPFLITAVWIVGLIAIAVALWLLLSTRGPDDAPATIQSLNSRIPPAMRPDAASSLKTPPFHIRRITNTPRHLLSDLGLDAHSFQIKTRPDRRVYLWVETYKNGKLQQDRSFGVMKEPQPDRPIQTTLRFTRLDPQTIREKGGSDTNRVRWNFGIGASAWPHWIDNPMTGLGMQSSAPATPTVWELGSGKTRTLWYLAAATHETGSVKTAPETERRQNDLYIALKCRVEPANPDRSGATFKSISRIPPE